MPLSSNHLISLVSVLFFCAFNHEFSMGKSCSCDFPDDGVPFALLSTYEMLGGIMCANLPIIFKLLHRTFRAVHSATSQEARSIPAEHSHEPVRLSENTDGHPAGWTPLPNNYYSHGNNSTTTFEAQTEALVGHNT